MALTKVYVDATDALTRAGLARMLGNRPEFVVLRDPGGGSDVALLADDGPIAAVWETVPAVPVVLLADRVGDLAALAARRVVAVVGRECPTGILAAQVLAAAALADAGQDRILAGLRQQIATSSVVLDESPAALVPREIDVLRLIAEGWHVPDIAEQLCYSERTIKNIVYAVTCRLNLRNRTHAVAYAVRAGLI